MAYLLSQRGARSVELPGDWGGALVLHHFMERVRALQQMAGMGNYRGPSRGCWVFGLGGGARVGRLRGLAETLDVELVLLERLSAHLLHSFLEGRQSLLRVQLRVLRLQRQRTALRFF